MIETAELRNRFIVPKDELLLVAGIYTLRFHEDKSVYVGKSDLPVWFRLRDHCIRPRYAVDWYLRRASRFYCAVFQCVPSASIEGISVLRAKKWCEQNGGKLLNEAIPIAHDTDIDLYRGKYKPEGDLPAMEVHK